MQHLHLLNRNLGMELEPYVMGGGTYSRKLQREWDTIEDDIAALEEAVENLEKEIEASATNFTKLNELMKEKEEKEAQLEEKMDRWVYLNDLAEQIEAQKNR